MRLAGLGLGWGMSDAIKLRRESRWRDLVRRQAAGRLSVAEFCRREGVALSTFHWWRRRLGAINPKPVQWVETQGAGLAPVFAAEAVPAVRAGTGAGLWIEFAAPPSAELLAATLAALHSLQRTSC